MSYDFDQQHQTMSSATKVLIGCGGAAFLCVALICGGFIFLGFRAVDMGHEVAKEAIEKAEQHMAEMEQQKVEYSARFVAEGYQHVDGGVMDVNSDIKEPTVYTAQVINLNANAEADVAILANVAEIKGNFEGDVHFRGNVVNIDSSTVIHGNLYLEKTEVAEVDGTVHGEVVYAAAPTEEEAATDDGAMPELKPPPGDVIDTEAKRGDEEAPDSPVEDGSRDEASDSSDSDAPASDDATDAPTAEDAGSDRE